MDFVFDNATVNSVHPEVEFRNIEALPPAFNSPSTVQRKIAQRPSPANISKEYAAPSTSGAILLKIGCAPQKAKLKNIHTTAAPVLTGANTITAALKRAAHFNKIAEIALPPA